jgi:uncharacterized protein DUF2393
MSSLGQPTPVAEERDSSRLIIGIAVAVVIAGALAAAFLLREPPRAARTASPYIANLKLSDFKMSAAENFIGATVSYVDGSVTNTGDKTVTHATVEVTFKDDMGQVAQREELPLRVLKTTGPYPEAVDLALSPLARGQSEHFRLTFDSISAQWNRQYPEMRITDVSVQ